MNRDQRDQTNKESPAWLRDKFKSMELESDPCPKCGKPLNDAPGGGVAMTFDEWMDSYPDRPYEPRLRDAFEAGKMFAQGETMICEKCNYEIIDGCCQCDRLCVNCGTIVKSDETLAIGPGGSRHHHYKKCLSALRAELAEAKNQLSIKNEHLREYGERYEELRAELEKVKAVLVAAYAWEKKHGGIFRETEKRGGTFVNNTQANLARTVREWRMK